MVNVVAEPSCGYVADYLYCSRPIAGPIMSVWLVVTDPVYGWSVVGCSSPYVGVVSSSRLCM